MSDDFKERAFRLAVELECEIYTYDKPEGGTITYWRLGMRGSADQYGRSFDDRFDAAIHFLTTQEARQALKMRNQSDMLLMEQCTERVLVK